MRYIIFTLVILHLFYACSFSDDFACVKPNWFKCDDGRCISRFFECDGQDDCGDFSDEKDCTGFTFKPDVKCASGEFRCLDNMCIPEEFVCDGNNDCLDSSDEVLGCTKDKHCDGFKCKNGYCILKEWRCDGTNDCSDNSDEVDCYHKLTPAECKPDKGYFLCENEECISLNKACDNKKDCSDGSDENVVGCKSAEQKCLSKICNHECHKTPKDAVCSCSNGYELLRNRVCVDADECTTYGICDHNCINLEGTFNCSCETGYELQSDKRSCKATDGEALLIYSSKSDIRGLYLTSQVMFYVARKLQHVVGVSIDSNHIYWSNVQLGNEVIVRSNEDGTKKEVIVTAGLGAPEDIAIDWVTGNVYFTDAQMKHIAVCTNNGSTCTIIVKEYADKPRGISLLPAKGEMFWSDWGEKPHISRAQMDGKNIKPFITSNIVWPNGITIDYHNHRLYWVDAKLSTIETVKLDGTDRRIVLNNIAKHPYSIAIFENKLYWSDWHTNSIQSCDKFTGKGHKTIAKEKNAIYGIHIYHSTLKPEIKNPCVHGLCSHICLLAPNSSYTCDCPSGKELSIDKHNCRVTEKEKRIIIGAAHMFIEIHHEELGKPKLSAFVLNSDISALAYDPQAGTVLASDKTKNAIFKYDPSSHETAFLITTDIGHVGGMDFDNLGRNLYWCDTKFKKINVFNVDKGEGTSLTEDSFEQQPMDLAVVSNYGLLYVVFKSVEHFHIDKIQMDGHGGRHHVVESGLLGPSISITYDSHLERIFWADQSTGTIESTSVEGTDRHYFRSNLRSPMSLAVVGNDIFWTTYDSSRVYWADKLGNIPGDKRTTLGIPDNMGILRLVSMTGYSSPTQTHPCLNKNGGCSHICLVASSQHHTCSCPTGMILDHDNINCVVHKNCRVYEMKCESDNSCVEKSKRCNGISDCPRGEDEIDCHISATCGIDHTSCGNGECIHDSKLCDSVYDCNDRSDEEYCSLKPCPAHQFQCKRGNCVSEYSVCDGRKDCGDGSDEENCKDHTCDKETAFTCESGGCVPKFWECDGQIDCNDGSDEAGQCGATICGENMFTCHNTRCVDTSLVCNLVDDCGDNSDERECKNSENKNQTSCVEDEFRCIESNICLPISVRCDGEDDCPMKDDELLCTDCESDQFTCANKKCIPYSWVCDRVDDCGDKSDEKDCNESGKSAIDGNGSSSDRPTHCNEFRCLTGECIPYVNVCNNLTDCSDHSDENGKCATSCVSGSPCEGICNRSPSGPICTCAEGYKLRNDGLTCEDIDECKLGLCSQICRNEVGSFGCSCFDEFHLRSDGLSCKATGPPMEIILATRHDIRKISAALKSVKVIYHQPGFGIGINGLDVNIVKKIVYWSSEITGSIFQLSLDTMEMRNVTKIGKPGTLAVDWATDNVYFYDSGSQHSIKVCNLVEQKCALVISTESSTTVNALAVDPKNGLIFWSQTVSWSYNYPTSEIYRASMSGKNQISIVSKQVVFVTGMAVDHRRGVLYWADRQLQIIERSDFNGNDRRIVISSNVHYPVGLNLFEDSLYWLTLETGLMMSCTLFGVNSTCKKMQISPSYQEQFTILHSSRQPSVENLCRGHNCSHICVKSDKEIDCLCPNGTVVPSKEICSNFTTMLPEFGVMDIPSRSDSGYVTGVMSTVFICLALLSGFYYYQKKKMDVNKCDLSIHFQNPTFGCDVATLPPAALALPTPGEHEYVNPVIDIRAKYPRKKVDVKKTLKVTDLEDIITSESEDGNYAPNTRLIDRK